MKAGKITAKLRDAVKVCFMVEGKEVKRYKNIEMPDALKELEIQDFHFNVLTDGKIEFWLHFDHGILPEEWPECRTCKARAAKVYEVAVIEAVEAPEADRSVAEPEIIPVALAVAREMEAASKAIEVANVPEVTQEAPEASIVTERAKRGYKPGKHAKSEPQPKEVAM